MSPRSSTIVLQSLVSGSVRDGLLGGPPRAPFTVRMLDRISGEEQPLSRRVLEDGTFTFYGTPERELPLVHSRRYRLRVEASAPRYAADSFDFDVGPAPAQPTLAARDVPLDGPAHVRLFTLPQFPRRGIVLTLEPEAVRLRGRVVVSDDPGTGVAGASVRIQGGPVTTADAEGRFEFPNPLPVATLIDLQVTATNFDAAQIEFEPNFSEATNSIVVPLKRS
jgi:hypothetical protein